MTNDRDDPKRWTERSAYLAAASDETVADERHFAPSAARNTEPILEVLRQLLPAQGRALEIASGTGQHVVAFARAWPEIVWHPSDADPAAQRSIAAWAAEAGLPNLRSPLAIDVTKPDWEAAIEDGVDVIVCINLLHISPWQACEGLMRGAGRALRPSGLAYLYGPYMRDGAHTAPSNADFDASLRHRNPDWGLRDIAEVASCAAKNGLVLERTVEMPANNLSLVVRRTAALS